MSDWEEKKLLIFSNTHEKFFYSRKIKFFLTHIHFKFKLNKCIWWELMRKNWDCFFLLVVVYSQLINYSHAVRNIAHDRKNAAAWEDVNIYGKKFWWIIWFYIHTIPLAQLLKSFVMLNFNHMSMQKLYQVCI